jgi:hypothetical protein
MELGSAGSEYLSENESPVLGGAVIRRVIAAKSDSLSKILPAQATTDLSAPKVTN